ncbi:unnamed protein product [Cuscuta europaea]|uniref:Uncharacterized protein n=1 Tax=Cuscuta europaea TaxID=41803 RepID=A0A9P0Z1M7_CUSEU|nr:unnamed protein product [Cuscuta europaea]
MGKIKQSKGELSARITKSRAGFELLDGLEDEFPLLSSTKHAEKSATKEAGKKSAVGEESVQAAVPKPTSAVAKEPTSTGKSSSSKPVNSQVGLASQIDPGTAGTVNQAGSAAKARPTACAGEISGKIVADAAGISATKPGLTAPTQVDDEPALHKQTAAKQSGGNKPAVHDDVTANKSHDKNGGAGVARAWSSLFKDNRDTSNGLKLRYIPPKGTSLDFTDRVLPSMVDMRGFCLVGFFTGKFPGLKAVYDLKNTWGLLAWLISITRDELFSNLKMMKIDQKC